MLYPTRSASSSSTPVVPPCACFSSLFPTSLSFSLPPIALYCGNPLAAHLPLACPLREPLPHHLLLGGTHACYSLVSALALALVPHCLAHTASLLTIRKQPPATKAPSAAAPPSSSPGAMTHNLQTAMVRVVKTRFMSAQSLSKRA